MYVPASAKVSIVERQITTVVLVLFLECCAVKMRDLSGCVSGETRSFEARCRRGTEKDVSTGTCSKAASSASPTGSPTFNLSRIPLSMVNTFSDISDASGGQAMFAESLQAKSLGLSKFTFSSSFFKCLQSKLEAALWQHYLLNTTNESSNVVVNMSAKKTETFVKFPIHPDLHLPFVGKVSMVKTKTCLPFVTLFGVPFWIDDCQSADILIGASMELQNSDEGRHCILQNADQKVQSHHCQ